MLGTVGACRYEALVNSLRRGDVQAVSEAAGRDISEAATVLKQSFLREETKSNRRA